MKQLKSFNYQVLPFIVILCVLLVGCSNSTAPQSNTGAAVQDEPTVTMVLSTPSLPPSPTPTATVTPEPSATPSPTRSATATPTPTESSAGLSTFSSDPIVKTLESQGYELQPELYSFKTTFSEDGFSAGGPDKKHPLSAELSIVNNKGQIYTYVQYVSPETHNCHLLFFMTEDNVHQLLADVDASQLSDRIKNVVSRKNASLDCFPYDWRDFNKNGAPDMAVTFAYGNQLDFEIHIFELTDQNEIISLTEDLPGVMSPWVFDPDSAVNKVFDLAWAKHDCIYPPIYAFWVYHWLTGPAQDGTTMLDLSPDI